jgi:hypothetical protein
LVNLRCLIGVERLLHRDANLAELCHKFFSTSASHTSLSGTPS